MMDVAELRHVARDARFVVAVVAGLLAVGAAYRVSGAPRAAIPTMLQNRFTHWTSDNGLPARTIYDIIQSHDGYIWLATVDGLVRFDGIRFVVFNTGTEPVISDNRFVSVFEDSRGWIWGKTMYDNVFRYDGRSWKHYELEFGHYEGLVQIREDEHGHVWALTGRAAFEIDGETVTRHSFEEWGIRTDSASPLTPGSGFGDDETYVAFVGHSMRRFTAADGLPDMKGAHVRRDWSDGLWITTADKQLYELGADGRFSHSPLGEMLWQTGVELQIKGRDVDGSLWFSRTPDLPLARLDADGTIVDFAKDYGYTHATATHAIQDREGVVWIVSNDGLFRYDRAVISYFAGARGPLWSSDLALVGGENRLLRIRYGAGQPTRGHPESVSLGYADEAPDTAVQLGFANDRRTDIFAVRDRATGDMLVSVNDPIRQFVARIRGRQVTRYEYPGALPKPSMQGLIEDRSGTLWFATDGGVYCSSVDAPDSYRQVDGLTNMGFTTLAEARDGAVWLAARDGVYRYMDGSLAKYTVADGLSSGRVRAIYPDSDGTIWFGTVDNGITRYKDGRFTAITKADGLFSHGAFAILEDDRGNLWMSSNQGIYRASKRDLDDFADGRLASITCVGYGAADGMRTVECNGGSMRSGWKLADGRLCFETIDAIAVVDPEAIPRAGAPPVSIEEARVENAEVALGPSLELKPGEGALEIHYTGLSFVKSEYVRFRYRLEGLGDGWNDVGTRRVAYFTNLPPGSYVFRVVAANADGAWNDVGASLRIVVLAPFYRTSWFLALVATVVALGVTFAVRGRIRALKRRHAAEQDQYRKTAEELEARVLERTAELSASERRALEASAAKSVFLANMSHELRTPLNAVIGFAQLLGRDGALSEDQRQQIGVIRRSGEHLLGLINDVLSISKIEAGRLALVDEPFDLQELLSTTEQMFRTRAAAKGLSLVIDVDDRVPRAVRGDEPKLRQVVLNLLGNAVKFTSSGTVTLRVRWSEGVASFEVEDTGVGIAPDEIGRLFEAFVQGEAGRRERHGSGLGLSISRRIVRLMGGDITVRSEPGVGTSFAFNALLPLADAAPAPQRRAALRLADPPNVRAIVADDVTENRELLRALLTGVGFEVREAEDGREAISLWESWRPPVLMLDARMPGLEGSEVARRIRAAEAARPPGGDGSRRTAIVAVTASAFEHDRLEMIASGCDAAIAKPFRFESVFEALETYAGLRFEYANEESAPARVTADVLAPLDRDLLDELYERLSLGDDVLALETVERIAVDDPRRADALRAAIRSAAFDEILTALESVLRRKGGALE